MFNRKSLPLSKVHLGRIKKGPRKGKVYQRRFTNKLYLVRGKHRGIS
jgi:hypothetical protein